MKKLIAALTLFVGLSAQASLLSVLVSDTDVAVGESFDVTIAANMTEDFNFLSFQLDFDTSMFDLVASSLSSEFSGLVSSFGLLEMNFTDFGFAFSFAEDLFEPELAAGEYQAAKFTLTAKAASAVPATFAFADGIFAPLAGNAAFDDVSISPDPQQGQASVAVNAVPAPATLGLFAIALFGLVGLRRKA